MATNEELALLIQQGHKEYISELWANCYKLLYMLSDKLFLRFSDKITACGYTQEDLHQGCFFVMLKMVEAYNPEKGYKFTSYAMFHLQKYFQYDVLHYNSQTKRTTDTLNLAISIEQPIKSGEAEDITLADTIQDDNSALAFESINNSVFNQELSVVLIQAVKQHLNNQQQKVIINRYFHSKTVRETADLLGVSPQRISTVEYQALRMLRWHKKDFISFIDYEIPLNEYQFTGYNSFRERMGSSEEILIEKAKRCN